MSKLLVWRLKDTERGGMDVAVEVGLEGGLGEDMVVRAGPDIRARDRREPFLGQLSGRVLHLIRREEGKCPPVGRDLIR